MLTVAALAMMTSAAMARGFGREVAGAHLATANRAVESAQEDIVTAFLKHRPPAR